MIRNLHEKIKKGEKTSTELTGQFFDSIEKDNQQLNAFLSLDKDGALERASRIDEKVKRGEEISMLEGIPCGIKDNICIKGRKATAASKILENYTAPYNATVVDKLDKQGAVYLGKTNLDEFAMGSSTENSAFGVTRNPFDEGRVAGGSSGGSACAVAADLAVWALGSDTGGSIRQPASFCGAVGFKPTYGRVSRYGLIAMASSYDQIGPITKSVEDAAIVFDAIKGNDSRDNTTALLEDEKIAENLEPNLQGVKIGVIKEFLSEGVDAEIRNIIKERISYAESRGAEIIEVELPHLKHSMAVYYIMQPSEVSSNLARFDGVRYGLSEPGNSLLEVYLKSRAKGLGAEPKRRVILGTYALSAGYYDAYYKKAQQVREVIKREIRDIFEKVDVLLSPTTPTPAFKIGSKVDNPLEMYLADICTVTANVAMIPAISLPAGNVVCEGKELPVGIQLMGKWWDEQKLLNIAAGLEIG